ncbi:MAG: hypothetical protein AAF556_12860, partial [Pseudomonadota bacterium]
SVRLSEGVSLPMSSNVGQSQQTNPNSPINMDLSSNVAMDPSPTTNLLRRHGMALNPDPLARQLAIRLIQQIHRAICDRRCRMTAARALKDDQLRCLSAGLWQYRSEDCLAISQPNCQQQPENQNKQTASP